MKRPLQFPDKSLPEAREALGAVERKVTSAVEAADGHRFVPVCPYVARWGRNHDDVAESMDRVRPDHLESGASRERRGGRGLRPGHHVTGPTVGRGRHLAPAPG